MNFFKTPDGKLDVRLVTLAAVLVVVLVVVLVGLSIFAPRYKKSVEYAASEHTGRVTAESQVTTEHAIAMAANQSAEKYKNLSRKSYYPNGKIKSETVLGEGEKSSSMTVYQAVTFTQSVTLTEAVTFFSEKIRVETITKRGGAAVFALFGADVIPKGAGADASLLGPLGAAAVVRWDNGFSVLAGPRLELP